jgi:hypothetical protein
VYYLVAVEGAKSEMVLVMRGYLVKPQSLLSQSLSILNPRPYILF